MIKENKKLNPFLGIAIGFVLILVPMFVMFTPIVYEVSRGLFMFIAFPFIISGIYFLVLNASNFGLKVLARKIDESAKLMNPETYLGNSFIITKVRDLYIVKFSDNYLNVLRMNEKENCTVSWYRRTFGPKLPTNLPIKCPIITEFNGYKIRKCIGKVILYDIVENQWISGEATMFSIFLFKKSLSQLLFPDVFQNLINLIETF